MTDRFADLHMPLRDGAGIGCAHFCVTDVFASGLKCRTRRGKPCNGCIAPCCDRVELDFDAALS